MRVTAMDLLKHENTVEIALRALLAAVEKKTLPKEFLAAHVKEIGEMNALWLEIVAAAGKKAKEKAGADYRWSPSTGIA